MSRRPREEASDGGPPKRRTPEAPFRERSRDGDIQEGDLRERDPRKDTQGTALRGDASTGEASESETSEGGAPEGKTPETSRGTMPDRETSEGETSEGRGRETSRRGNPDSAEGKPSDGEAPGGEAPERGISERRTTGTTLGGNPEKRISEGETPERGRKLEAAENEDRTVSTSRAARRWRCPRMRSVLCPRAGQLAAEDLGDEGQRVNQQSSSPLKTLENEN